MFLVQVMKNERVESVILDTGENNVNYVSRDKLMLYKSLLQAGITPLQNLINTDDNL